MLTQFVLKVKPFDVSVTIPLKHKRFRSRLGPNAWRRTDLGLSRALSLPKCGIVPRILEGIHTLTDRCLCWQG